MRFFLIFLVLSLPGCDLAQRILPGSRETADPPADAALSAIPEAEAETPQPQVGPQGTPIPDASLPPPVGLGSSLGTTVVSLGDPGEGGMWLKTPLVRSERPGQVGYQGSVVALTLRPLAGEAGSGSQISLRAMQALGAPLSELVEVTVQAN